MSAARGEEQDLARTIKIVQTSFPQIYLACHTRHQRKRSTEHRLSARDASILAHLDLQYAITPARLAKHLGVARSTLSEALKRLIRLGYAAPPEVGGGRRLTGVLLSERGAKAISDTSVLETARLEEILRGLDRRGLEEIAAGMMGLSTACRVHAESARRRRGMPG